MLKRYKEIFFGLLLGLVMWGADAVMHTMMPMSDNNHQSAFVEELFFPDGLQLITRLLFVGFALFLGWLLWRSNQRERAVRDLERRMAVFHEQVINPASSILEECSALLRSDGLKGESVELVKEIRQHARQIDDFAKDFPRRTAVSPGNDTE
ncbi:MAG: hypothetical protein AB7P14_07835 [Blastocatellales bacterium]